MSVCICISVYLYNCIYNIQRYGKTLWSARTPNERDVDEDEDEDEDENEEDGDDDNDDDDDEEDDDNDDSMISCSMG